MVQRGISFPDVKGQDIICDLDGTLIEGDIGESTFLQLHLKDYLDGDPTHKLVIPPGINRKDPGVEIVARYLDYCKAKQFDLAYRYTSEEIAKFQPQEISRVVSRFLNSSSGQREIQLELHSSTHNNGFKTSYGVTVRQRLMKLISKFQSHGALLWIVSASPQYVVDACGAAFNFPSGNVFGAVPETKSKENGRFPWKSGKEKVLRESGVLNPLVVFGNGLEDLEMLKLARYPIVMEDGHPELVAYARERDWYIYNSQLEVSINGKKF